MWWPHSSGTSRCPSVCADVKAGVSQQVGKMTMRLSKWISRLCKYATMWVCQNHIEVNENNYI